MVTVVFYFRCLGVWRYADIHFRVNVDDVICKVRLVFRNCVEIIVGIFESQKCIQCEIFVVLCNRYISNTLEVLIHPKYSCCLPCHNNNNYNVCYMKLCVLLQSILDSVISGNFQ
jgi:hypothetical protein